MARTPIFGTCHICGATGVRLSFEHVPPEAAFNDHAVVRTDFQKLMTSDDLDHLTGRQQQRGAGAHTLCERCNNNTGSWYGTAYAEFAFQAMAIIIATRAAPTLVYPFNLYPLRLLKQVICMFFSVNSPEFQQGHAPLVRFVLNKESRDFPNYARVYAFYTVSSRSRAVGFAGLARGIGGGRQQFHVFSEITFPPLGFVMTLGDHPPPEAGLCEISGFSAFGYNEWRAGITMRLPVKPIYTGFPGDYRTRDETLADLQRNIAA